MPTGPMRNRTAFTPMARAEFLEELAVLGSMRSAAAAAGIASSVIDYHKAGDPTFAEDIADALDRHDRLLMQQVKKMALDGIVVAEVRNDHGVVIRQERKYSERLLLAYLKRQESGSWADRVQVNQTVTGKVEHQHSGRIEVESLSPEQRRKARDFLASLN